MTPDWEKNYVLVADLLRKRYPVVFRKLSTILSKRGVPLNEVPNNRDIWIRDAAPVEVNSNEFVQFRYQPDYLRKDKDLITPAQAFSGLSFIKSPQKSKLVIDGGNIVGTASTAILTDKVFTENPTRDPDELENELKCLLQVQRLIFIPQETGDIIGHSDGMVRFLTDKQVILNDYRKEEPELGEELEEILTSNGIKFTRIPYVPEDQVFDGIPSAVGNYVNFLRVGNLMIVPAYGFPEDEIVQKLVVKLLPQCMVESLPCRDLAEEGGVLNCATWTIRHAELV